MTPIDHIFTNSPDKVSQSGVIDLGLSDHDLIYCTRKTSLPKSHKHNEIFVRSMKWYSTEKFLEILREIVFPNYLTYPSEAVVQKRFCKKGVVRNFAKFAGKHLCQPLFFNKVAGLRPATLLKKRHWHRCFPVNFVKFLRTPFFIEHLWWLLLILV